jgi:membrane-associated phospholipid phosphatase
MRRRPQSRREVTRPGDRRDAVRQLSLVGLAYLGYETVRGLVGIGGPRPVADAARIVWLERTLHVFAEPRLQSWVTHNARWLLDLADWTYLNAHLSLSAAALLFIYLRRNDSFYFVRNMFAVAMLVALVGYCVFPTAPPRLMPQWGFSDSIRQFTGLNVEHGAVGLLVNPYAAVPSMHVGFALMIGLPMSRLVHSRAARLLWRVYPLWIAFVVVVTGNHYFTDIALGALTAAISAALAKQLFARARPDVWAFAGVPA